jgi:TolA-binding protein
VLFIRQAKTGDSIMNALLVSLSLLLLLALLNGCSSPEMKAAELLETAQFEEKQSNREHAAKLYDEILTKYPASQAATAAAARIAELKSKKP